MMKNPMMRAARCCGSQIDVVDVPRPNGDGVRIRVASAGICSSDLHMVAAGFPVDTTLGHEVAGFLSDGRAVAIEPLSPCGHCDMCLNGSYHMCRRGPATIHGVGKDGGMAEEIIIPSRCIVPLPSNVSAADACLVEPLAVAAHGLRMLKLTPASRIAIIGAGAIGLCATAILSKNISTVHLSARHAAQIDAGERLGAAIGVDGEYDVVVECAGNSAALATAARLCKPGGTILLLASYWEGVELPAMDVAMKNLVIRASSLYSRHGLVRDVDVAAQLLAQRPEIAAILITHRLPLASAKEAFAIAAEREQGAIKVVLEP